MVFQMECEPWCNYWSQRSCGQGYVFTRVCDSVHGGSVLSQHALQEVSWHALQQVSRGVCYPSMYCRWYPSMPCSRSPGGAWSRGPALGGVPGWGVPGLGGACSSGVAFCYGLLFGGFLVWWPSDWRWPSSLVAFWLKVAFWFGGLLVWWPSVMAFWCDLLLWPSGKAFWYLGVSPNRDPFQPVSPALMLVVF